MWLKNKVLYLTEKYNTQDPFELALHLNTSVIKWDLHKEIRGYYKYDRRNKYIVINDNLEVNMQRVVCAHELGHAVLHPHANTPFMKQNTLLSVSRIEREANRFAAELLIPDNALRNVFDQLTMDEIASYHKVPVELVRLKFKELF